MTRKRYSVSFLKTTVDKSDPDYLNTDLLISVLLCSGSALLNAWLPLALF